jgi:hypothetical protein
MTSGFRREADKNCSLLDYYAASSGNSLPTFRDNLSVQSSRVKSLGHVAREDGTLKWFRNVGKELLLLAA